MRLTSRLFRLRAVSASRRAPIQRLLWLVVSLLLLLLLMLRLLMLPLLLLRLRVALTLARELAMVSRG